MLIKNLFERDIFRSINGVVKAEQLDDSSVWQELDEFVITREIDQHLRNFVSWYLDALKQGKNAEASGKMGVWISGFFGSGKSHFLKVLSYLLRNRIHTHEGEGKKAVEFFESKVKDALLFGDIKSAVAADTDVILFNIDSKAGHGSGMGRDLILQVFLKVLNELQGYSAEHPHIANMERHLASQRKLEAFHSAYKKHTGESWLEQRDAYHFHRDQVVAAFVEALGQSQATAEKWVDGAEEKFSISVEGFCKSVKEYLDSKGPEHRIVFLADEVGQFIGNDSHLMLNLQTITEDLGMSCHPKTTAADLRRLALWLTVDEPDLRPFIDEAVATVQAVSTKEFWAEAKSSPECHEEVPFAIRVAGPDGTPKILNGTIDSVFRHDDGWKIVDYKTDLDGTLAVLEARYGKQLAAYEDAWRRFTSGEVKSSIVPTRKVDPNL